MVGLNRQRFPLRLAYPFGEDRGLTAQVRSIKAMTITWPKTYNATVRRGYLIAEFQEAGILNEFVSSLWPFGDSAKGRSEIAACLRVSAEYEAHRRLR